MDSERLCGAFPENLLEMEWRNLERQCGGFPEHSPPALDIRGESLAYEYSEFLEAPTLGVKVGKKNQVYEYDGFQET